MGYDDKFYYGQCKLVVKADYGKVVATSTDTTVEGIIDNGKCVLMIPSGNEYNVTCRDRSKTIYAGFGDCIKVELGD